jgi:hypothetical protein
MTATGNMSRAVVAEMCDRTDWPGYDKAEMLKYCKIVNEPDYLPLFFLRHVVEAAKLIRRYKGYLKATPAGRKLSRQPDLGALASILLHITFWRFNLAYLWGDRLAGWPQSDIGIILWSLSIAAHDWQTTDRLTRLCTIPVDSLLNAAWDIGSAEMEARILRPLTWFGLLEFRDAERESGQWMARRSYRKTALFDRLVSFDIQQSDSPRPHH